MYINILGNIPDAVARIYSLNDLVNPIWNGKTDVNGKVVDNLNNMPSLAYGNYRIVIQKCDYDTTFQDFAIPEQKLFTLTVGCSSALESHRLNDVHVQPQPSIGGADPGDIKITARSTPPAGWLICDGSAIDRTIYANLFNAIGTSYGVGNGVTTFNIPDFMGRTVIGAGSGIGLTIRIIGNTGGEETHRLTVAELAAHTHIQAAVQAASGLSGSGILGNGPSNTGSTGLDIPHNNMQPFGVANYIIKT